MDNVTERDILCLSAEKISRLPGGQLVFLSREANIPLLPSRRGVIERTYFILRNRRIEVKKISPYDTE